MTDSRARVAGLGRRRSVVTFGRRSLVMVVAALSLSDCCNAADRLSGMTATLFVEAATCRREPHRKVRSVAAY